MDHLASTSQTTGSLALATLNAALEVAVFAEPQDRAHIADLMLLIGGRFTPATTMDQIRDAAHRVTLALAAPRERQYSDGIERDPSRD